MSTNEIHAAMRALASYGRVSYDPVDNSILIATPEEDHLVSLDWLDNHCVVPIELDEKELARAKPRIMAMKVGHCFTWNSWARHIWATLIGPHLTSPYNRGG